MTKNTLAIDFGTSNTAAGGLIEGVPQIIPLEGNSDTLPTTVFLDYDRRSVTYGAEAVTGLIEGRDGRFMRALKSVLGAPLMREQRQFMNERKRLLDVVAEFLAELRLRAERATGQSFTSVLSGRPVHFRGAGDDRDAKAIADLSECYRLAGFKDIAFMPEPEAAARAVLGPDDGRGAGLVVDIGGGTSDFSVFRYDGEAIEILASHGLKIGGTDFDRVLSLGNVMPLLGMGSRINNVMGPGSHTAPNGVFFDLATWEKIPFVYSPATLRDAEELRKLAQQPELLTRLVAVLRDELGHDLAFATEAAKIAANDTGTAKIALGIVEQGLTAALSAADLEEELADYANEMAAAAIECAASAGVRPDEVTRLVFVGGSSLMQVVRGPVSAAFPHAKAEVKEAFTAIVHGLTRSLAPPRRSG